MPDQITGTTGRDHPADPPSPAVPPPSPAVAPRDNTPPPNATEANTPTVNTPPALPPSADQKLTEVFGDTIHRNDGRHLDGGIADDQCWQRRYDAIVANSHTLYLPPQGRIGAAVITQLAAELRGVRERKWNSERPLAFAACVLRRRHGCVRAADIKRRIEKRLSLWQEGRFDALIQDITTSALADAGPRSLPPDDDTIARRFNSKVLDGELRAAVRQLTARNSGGILGPDDACTKTGRKVSEVLADKHPPLRTPDIAEPDRIAFQDYGTPPDIIPIDCPNGDAEKVSRKLRGSAGCSGLTAEALKNMLLRHGRASSELRDELTEWALWLANSSPPWAAYRAMRQGRLVALDKQPGVRPVGIGETWMRAVSKLVLAQCGMDGKEACGNSQLCAGLEAGIEGAIHAATKKAAAEEDFVFQDWEVVDDSWGEAASSALPPDPTNDGQDAATTPAPPPTEAPMTPEDPTVLLLADADNGFNNLSRYAMLWEARHRWPSGSRFAYNLYRHECRLLLRGPPGTTPALLLSREGVMQGCVWGMILYGIGLLPLAEHLRQQDPTVLQPWYADDFAMEGPSSRVATLFTTLCQKGPSIGYFPAPAKSWAICPRASEPSARKIFEDSSLPVKFSRGQRYVGGFIGSTACRDTWLRPKIDSWVHGVSKLAAVATRFPHSAYAGLVSCLAAEWQYACRTVPNIGPLLAPIEHAIRTAFLPAILGPDITIDDDLRDLLALGVKSGGLAIRDPTRQAEALYHSSREATSYLSDSLLRSEPISTHHHRSTVRAAGTKSRKERRDGEDAFLQALLARSPPKVKKRLERVSATGAWLTTIPDRFAGTELTKHEWLDNIALRYGSRPPHLPSRCDGCGEGFTVEHALNCKKGGLVGIRHDDARDEWAHLCSLAFANAKVVIEPNILYGNDSATGPSRAATPNSPPPPNDALGDESRGDVLVHCFWQRARGTIFDVRICDTDARSYANTSSDKVLERASKEKVRKYEQACLAQRRDFTPLVYSVDGLASKDARNAERRLASVLAKKWGRSYSDMANFIRTRMSLAIVRSNTLLLRGDRNHSLRRRAPLDGTAVASTESLHNA